ncbi:MAG: hypothetical protein V8R30_05280 [Clostridia bacterium]
MSKTIKPENLQKVLSDYLENYVEDITEDVEDTTDTLTKEAVQELKTDISKRDKEAEINHITRDGQDKKVKKTGEDIL